MSRSLGKNARRRKLSYEAASPAPDIDEPTFHLGFPEVKRYLKMREGTFYNLRDTILNNTDADTRLQFASPETNGIVLLSRATTYRAMTEPSKKLDIPRVREQLRAALPTSANRPIRLKVYEIDATEEEYPRVIMRLAEGVLYREHNPLIDTLREVTGTSVPRERRLAELTLATCIEGQIPDNAISALRQTTPQHVVLDKVHIL